MCGRRRPKGQASSHRSSRSTIGTWLGPQEQLADRVRGCLFGAALGDAAGLSAEFMSKAEVLDQGRVG